MNDQGENKAELRKLRYGNEVHVVSGVMNQIATEIVELTENLERIPVASPEMVEEHTSKINKMLIARCNILQKLSGLL